MDRIKNSFEKVRKDIDSLNFKFNFMKKNFEELKEGLTSLVEIIKEIKINTSNKKNEIKTEKEVNSTNLEQNTLKNIDIKVLKSKNEGISIGNEGVQTDRQTDRQTDKIKEKENVSSENYFDKALNALNLLDNAKKEIRLKFKRLTDQELKVFSTIYQLEEEFGYSNYKSLSNKLNLSESSIRDYVGRLIFKKIPIDKIKVNNKGIRLKISSNFKKITSLNTILTLIDL